MQFRTELDIQKATFNINPRDKILFTGSCFADNMGKRFKENNFNTVVNPFGVMYNPASILHTVKRHLNESEFIPDIAVFTLGTNHVYILKETGEIVANCMKRPQKLFHEKELTIAECKEYISEAVSLLKQANPDVKVIFTVSPIRYAKYGFHGSQLSKATLLLAVNELTGAGNMTNTDYFPAYEIMNDELRDYRFYAPDMLHPSDQAVEFIYEKFAGMYFSAESNQFVKEWQPIKAALSHRPFNPDSTEYKAFLDKAMADKAAFCRKWNV